MSAQTSRKRSEIAKYKILPSLKTIWKIGKLHLELCFKTDSLKRLYAWQSIVALSGNLDGEYLVWFVYYYTTIDIIAAFKANLRLYGDLLLEDILKDGLILVKMVSNNMPVSIALTSSFRSSIFYTTKTIGKVSLFILIHAPYNYPLKSASSKPLPSMQSTLSLSRPSLLLQRSSWD